MALESIILVDVFVVVVVVDAEETLAVKQLDQSCQTLLSQRDTKLSSVEKSHISYITIPQSFQHQPPTQGSFCHHYHEAPSKSALSTLSSLPPLPIAIALLLFVTVTTWPIIKKNCHHLTSKQGLLEPRQFKKPTTTATPGMHTHTHTHTYTHTYTIYHRLQSK